MTATFEEFVARSAETVAHHPAAAIVAVVVVLVVGVAWNPAILPPGRLRSAVQRLRVRRRRRKLLNAYARVYELRTGKAVGITPTMAAYDQAVRDGVLSIEGGELVWHWPPDAPDVDGDGEAETDTNVPRRETA